MLIVIRYEPIARESIPLVCHVAAILDVAVILNAIIFPRDEWVLIP
jgi:hypothetical protein